MELYGEIRRQAAQAAAELLAAAKLEPGDLLVVGCSTSEIAGQHIGRQSNLALAQAVFSGLYPVLQAQGVALAAQCCEHLNRALILEKETAARFGYPVVNVRPQPKAGGAFATVAWDSFAHPVAVEHIQAAAGLDIGGTFIGMHLREVAVPVRLPVSRIGDAVLLCARTRPKFIGGGRAAYCDELK